VDDENVNEERLRIRKTKYIYILRFDFISSFIILFTQAQGRIPLAGEFSDETKAESSESIPIHPY